MLLDCWQNVRRLLITLGGIEDVVLIEPVLRMLRQSLPDTNITLMTTPACNQVALQQSWVDEVLVYESGVMTLDTQREITLIEKLRDRRFDAAVIFTNESPYPLAYMCYLAGIPIRLGQSQEFGGSVLSQCVKPKDLDTPLVDKHLFLLESAGFPLVQPSSLLKKAELKQH